MHLSPRSRKGRGWGYRSHARSSKATEARFGRKIVYAARYFASRFHWLRRLLNEPISRKRASTIRRWIFLLGAIVKSTKTAGGGNWPDLADVPQHGQPIQSRFGRHPLRGKVFYISSLVVLKQ